MDYLGAPNTAPQRSNGSYAEEIKRRPTLISTSSIPRPIGVTKTERRRSPHNDLSEALVKKPYSQTTVCNDRSGDSPQKKRTSEPRYKEKDTRASR
ncbi:hypothetical protein ElyMa_002851600 [Elysia marginata]|uniref:Uncharacterized protein n=1 Tax=Elysia marginata TaxID=1093978 RepID=A0AAV4HWY3_9GAST|nr:hypothetical protein ElyMa_002851600 [Elysia marginata]